MAFFGQIRDRLIILLRDERERRVPDIMDWQITECDINRDIKLSHLLHYSAVKIQVKYLDHLFRIYIKSMGNETVCRVEESLHPKKSALETINDIFNPMEKVEKQIAALNTKISAIYDIVSKPPSWRKFILGGDISPKWAKRLGEQQQLPVPLSGQEPK